MKTSLFILYGQDVIVLLAYVPLASLNGLALVNLQENHTTSGKHREEEPPSLSKTIESENNIRTPISIIAYL